MRVWDIEEAAGEAGGCRVLHDLARAGVFCCGTGLLAWSQDFLLGHSTFCLVTVLFAWSQDGQMAVCGPAALRQRVPRRHALLLVRRPVRALALAAAVPSALAARAVLQDACHPYSALARVSDYFLHKLQPVPWAGMARKRTKIRFDLGMI